MIREHFKKWMQGYLKAWTSNDPDEIGALFTEDAKYYTQAFRQPWAGRDTIVKGWMGRVDEQGNWDFEYEIITVDGQVGVIEGLTTYREPPTAYKNIWFVTLDADGRCQEFKEFWIQRPEEG